MTLQLDKSLESWIEKGATEAQEAEKKGVVLIVHFLIGITTTDDVQVAHVAKCVLPQTVHSESGDELSKLVDAEWITDAAEKVVRMLPGGVSIVGLAVFCNKKVYNEQRQMLGRAMSKIHRITNAISSMGIDPVHSVMAVVHIDSATKKTTAVTSDVARRAQDFPCKLSWTALRWVSLVARCVVDMRCPVDGEGDFYSQLNAALEPWATELFQSDLITFDGEIRGNAEPLFIDPKKAKNSYCIQAQLFLPAATSKDQHGNASSGTLELSFDLAIRAVVPFKCIIADAKRALRQHIIRNLLARASLHYESMEVLEGQEKSGGGQALHQLPRAATTVLPTQSSVLLYDFLFDGDTSEDAQRNFDQLLGIKPSLEEIDDLWERNLTQEEVAEPALALHLPNKHSGFPIALPLLALSVIVVVVAFIIYIAIGK